MKYWAFFLYHPHQTFFDTMLCYQLINLSTLLFSIKSIFKPNLFLLVSNSTHLLLLNPATFFLVSLLTPLVLSLVMYDITLMYSYFTLIHCFFNEMI